MKKSIEELRENINSIDKEMSRLFEERMAVSCDIAEYKRECGLPVRDAAREDEVVRRGTERIDDPALRPYYKRFIKQNMALSRAYQSELLAAKQNVRTIHIGVEGGDYDITVGRGLLSRVGEYFNLERRVLILTDSGVPCEYAGAVRAAAKCGVISTIPEGEGSKSFSVLEGILGDMLECGFDRGDCIVAVGGGVVGDIAGLAASLYMRGIDFYNIPTTLLSQVDSSIGGKTAINLGGVKNTVGAFYQPRGVLIDPELLATLPPEQMTSGLAEAVKMAITSDAELFELIEGGDIAANLEEIITRSLMIKKRIVEEDERESGLRRILNFGHTLGHGIEATNEKDLTHGECVALGMIPVCDGKIAERVLPVLNKIGVNTDFEYNLEAAMALIAHDKKASGGSLYAILADEIGNAKIEKMSFADFEALVKRRLGK